MKLYISCIYQFILNGTEIDLKLFFSMKHENRTTLPTTNKTGSPLI